MTKCPRVFEVEAARDGRFAGADRARVESHARSCADCAAEARALDALGDALRAAPVPAVDDLAARRGRQRLLAAFDASRASTGGARRARWAVPAVVGLAAALGAAFIVARGGAPVVPPASVTVAEVTAEGAARWSRDASGGIDRLRLDEGQLAVRVLHGPGALRTIVALPDGELEDRGTVFTVRVEGGHTSRVAVTEGSVVLRLRGAEARLIEAGRAWERAAEEVAPDAGASLTASPSASAPRPSPSAGSPGGTDDSARAAAELRAAVALMNAGQDRRAADAFRAFAIAHPRDPRAEDAMVLRVVTLQRAGDVDGVRAAAAEYVRAYPNGFRRPEVEALAR